MLRKIWNDEFGVVISAELILVLTILVIGMIVGLTTLRDQIVQELGDVAQHLAELNQSYSFSGITGHHSSTSGTITQDVSDSCDGTPDAAGAPPACIDICAVAGLAE